jgi:uncharacterized protein (DUF952 family)
VRDRSSGFEAPQAVTAFDLMRLFHIASGDAWLATQTAGEYRTPSLAEIGFIHLSTQAQWLATLGRFYRGVPGLVLLVIDSDRLNAPLRFERADGEDFPHLYGALPLEAVLEVRQLPAIDELPARVPTSAAFEACVRSVDAQIEDVVACSVRGQTFVVLGVRGDVSLRAVMRAEALLPVGDRVARAGWLELRALPRDEAGALDEPWLLVTVHRMTASDDSPMRTEHRSARRGIAGPDEP